MTGRRSKPRPKYWYRRETVPKDERGIGGGTSVYMLYPKQIIVEDWIEIWRWRLSRFKIVTVGQDG